MAVPIQLPTTTLNETFGGVTYHIEGELVPVTVDPFGTDSERYIPSLNRWISDAALPVALYNNLDEMGAGLLLPDGRALFLGGTGHTALYTPSGNTNQGAWAAGPDIPGGLGTSDAPAAMMVNGRILCAVGNATNYGSPDIGAGGGNRYRVGRLDLQRPDRADADERGSLSCERSSTA